MVETETVLLQRFAGTGDAEALAEIIRRHAGLVYGVAWRILADMDRAGDVAQETFLQLTKDAAKVTGSLPGWLHRVATHKAIDSVRRDTSRRHRERQYAAQKPREATQWRDLSPYVDEGLGALDTEMRDILVAHFLEGQTTRQIAGKRGMSQATVSRRLEAGVAQLRGSLRRRGLIVSAGALSLLLGDNAVNAAPAGLMTELGKMALVGGQAAVVSASATASVGSFSELQTVIGGALASVKAKAAVAAAAAVISVGSVATYRYATRPPAEAGPTAARMAAAPRRSGPRTSMVAPGGPDRASGRSEAAQEWDRMMAAVLDQAGGRGSDTPMPQDPALGREAIPVEQEVGAAAEPMYYGGMMGGFAMAADPSADPNGAVVAMGGMGMGGGYYASRYTIATPGPNDANDPNETSAQDP